MTFRSFNMAVTSICGTQGAVRILLHSVFCRSFAVCCNVCGTVWGLCPSPALLQHRSTSLTSPSIPRENTRGKTAWTRSSTDFLRDESRHTRFSINSPLKENKETIRTFLEEASTLNLTTTINLSYLEVLTSCKFFLVVKYLQRLVEDSSCPGWYLCCQRQTWQHQMNALL